MSTVWSPVGRWPQMATRWIPTKRRDFLFPVKALSRVFRGKYLTALQSAYVQDRLQWPGPQRPWGTPGPSSVSSRRSGSSPGSSMPSPPLPRPSMSCPIWAAIRIGWRSVMTASWRCCDGQVAFRWRDRRRGNRPKVMTLTADEFIRRFLLHVLPKGFMRIRHYGVLGNRCRTPKRHACRQLLAQPRAAAAAP